MTRATAPVLGAVLLVGVTVLLAVALTVAAAGFAPPEAADRHVIDVTADAASGRVTIEHVAGPPLDVRTITLQVTLDDEPLVHQPPVPFFAATGFYGGPTGPFNPAADPTWHVGEVGSFRIAGTNAPTPSPGTTLSVALHRDGRVLARASTAVD